MKSLLVLADVLAVCVLKLGTAQEMLPNTRCNDYPDRGTCQDRGYIVKWYYDRFSHRCREFFYGGCGGNLNKFESFEDCSRECHFESNEMEAQQRCSLPHDPGTCLGDFQRWIFDWQAKKCVCSYWSGCGGNANRYYSYDHCMSICGPFAVNQSSNQPPASDASQENFHIPASQMRKRDENYFQSAPAESFPNGYQNLFISGRGNSINHNSPIRSHQIIIRGGQSPITLTRILPPPTLYTVSQHPRDRHMPTHQIFQLQQQQRHDQQTRREDTSAVYASRQQENRGSSSTETLQEAENLTAEQRAQLEARRWKKYRQEEVRIREENYQRQLQAMREQEEALNLQRYHQRYPEHRTPPVDQRTRQSITIPSRPKGSFPVSQSSSAYGSRKDSRIRVTNSQRLQSEATRRAEEQAEARRAELEEAARRAKTEALVRQREEAEAQARRDEAAAQARRVLQAQRAAAREAARRRAAEQAAQRHKEVKEAEARRKAAKAEAKRKIEKEAAARRKALSEAKARRKAAKEAERQRAEAKSRREAAERAQARRKAAELAEARWKAAKEAEARRKAAERAEARRKAEERAEERRKAAKLAESRWRAALRAAARRKSEKETEERRKAAEEAETRRKEIEKAELQRMAALDAEARRRDVEEAEARRKQAEEAEARREAAEQIEIRRREEEEEAQRRAAFGADVRRKADEKSMRLASAEKHSSRTEEDLEAAARRNAAEATVLQPPALLDHNELEEQLERGEPIDAKVTTKSYEERQLDYYRELQEYRRKQMEQIRERQLRDRENELKYREELLRYQQNVDAARALDNQRRQQHTLSSASAEQAGSHTSVRDDRRRLHQIVPQQSSQQETVPSQDIGRKAPTNQLSDGSSRSWTDPSSRKAYFKQEILVREPETVQTTTTAAPPPETTTERRSEAERRRADAKARKRARFERLKKLERLGLLPLSTTPKATSATTAMTFAATSSSVMIFGEEQSSPSILGSQEVASVESEALQPSDDSGSWKPGPLIQAKKLSAEVIRSAERVAEEDGATLNKVIVADKKNVPLNQGKVILSLDDYDDEEWIEEDYDVDEDGDRTAEDYNTDEEQNAEDAENAFRIKIHNKGVLNE